MLASCAMPYSSSAQKRLFLPPTMGWSTWNTYGSNINEEKIIAQTDAIVRKGLSKIGFQYINIDDGYQDGRGEDGIVRVNKQLFPHGMKYVADYIHSKGLKAGIYSDAGDNTCASQGTQSWGLGVGLAGHEYQDCKLYFNDWGYDFIKVDYCGGNHLGLNERKQYTKIGNAIKRCERETGRRIVFNVCRWRFPGTWIENVADSWRTTHDILATWNDAPELDWGRGVKSIIRQALYEQAYTGDGHYNDMDMLQVGHELTPAEEQTHFAVWCICSSPLLIGCDMQTIKENTLSLLKNTDLIAMNQDALGLGAPVVQREGDVYVLAKDMEKLHGEKRAVAVINLSDREQTVEVSLQALGFQGKVSIHDCFTKAEGEVTTPTMTVTVPAHGTKAYFFTGQRQDKTLYQAEEAWLHDYQRIFNKPTATPTEATAASGGVMVENIGDKESNYLEWRDVYVRKGGKYKLTFAYAAAKDRDLEVSVNGGKKKTFENLNTGSWNAQWSTCSVEVTLKTGANTVRLGSAEGFAPNIDYMRVVRL